MLTLAPPPTEAQFLLRAVETWRPHMTVPTWITVLLLAVCVAIALVVTVWAAVGFLIGSSAVLLAGRAVGRRRHWLPGGR